jgi:hypothetical protein
MACGCLDNSIDPVVITPESNERESHHSSSRPKIRRSAKSASILHMVVRAQRDSVKTLRSRPDASPSKSLSATPKDPFRCGISRPRNERESLRPRRKHHTRDSARFRSLRALKMPSTKFPVYPTWMPVKATSPRSRTASPRRGKHTSKKASFERHDSEVVIPEHIIDKMASVSPTRKSIFRSSSRQYQTRHSKMSGKKNHNRGSNPCMRRKGKFNSQSLPRLREIYDAFLLEGFQF